MNEMSRQLCFLQINKKSTVDSRNTLNEGQMIWSIG